MGRHSQRSVNKLVKRQAKEPNAQRRTSDRENAGTSGREKVGTSTGTSAGVHAARRLAATFRSLSSTRKGLVGGLAAALLLTAIAAYILFPTGPAPEPTAGFRESQSMAAATVTGQVTEAGEGPCGSPDAGLAFTHSPTFPEGAANCHRALVKLTSGDDKDKYTLIETSGAPGEPVLEAGDRVVLGAHTGGEAGTSAASPGASTTNPGATNTNPGASTTRYTFVDIDRAIPIWIWVAITVALIILVGAKRGALALLGLALTLVAVGIFLVPGLLRGGDPVWLAVTTGALVMFPVIFLVHGINWKSAASLAGTLLTLVFAAGLAQVAITTTHLRGLSDDSNLLIQLYLPSVSVTGLLLAGFIVGALGVLNDVTIAQASTVQELFDAKADSTPFEVFRSAMRVGQDHIASMVYTLVLAYLGAALPMSMLLAVADRPILGIISSDLVAVELMRSAVGALALTAAVPITTAIAAWTVAARD